MAIVNHAKREINAKIVIYGHEGAGKSTTLRYLHERIKPSLRSELKSQPASGGSLLFFDFCPFEHPVLGGYRIRFHIYTLPGRVSNPAAWKMTLKGADGLVLVVDAAPDANSAAKQSIVRLRDYLASYGMGLGDIPAVLQVNKADLAGMIATEAVATTLELGNIATCLSTALSGEGVLETFSTVSRQVMARLSQDKILLQGQEPVSFTTDPDQSALSKGETEGTLSGTDSISTFNTAEAAADTSTLECGGDLEIALADTVTSLADGTLRIPLKVSLHGLSRRLVLSIAIEPDREMT